MSMDKFSEKTVIIIGATGIGKSTFIEQITDIKASNLTGNSDWFSDTVSPGTYTRLVSVECGNEISYTLLKVIDTPGFDETKEDNARCDHEIAMSIVDYIRTSVPVFDLILFATNLGKGNSKKELVTKIMSTLGPNFDNYGLLITRCENMTDNQCNDKLSMYKAGNQWVENYFNGPVFYTGRPVATNTKSVEDQLLRNFRFYEELNKINPVNVLADNDNSYDLQKNTNLLSSQQSAYSSSMALESLCDKEEECYRKANEVVSIYNTKLGNVIKAGFRAKASMLRSENIETYLKNGRHTLSVVRELGMPRSGQSNVNEAKTMINNYKAINAEMVDTYNASFSERCHTEPILKQCKLAYRTLAFGDWTTIADDSDEIDF